MLLKRLPNGLGLGSCLIERRVATPVLSIYMQKRRRIALGKMGALFGPEIGWRPLLRSAEIFLENIGVYWVLKISLLSLESVSGKPGLVS